jgi:hypothetical protein
VRLSSRSRTLESERTRNTTSCSTRWIARVAESQRGRERFFAPEFDPRRCCRRCGRVDRRIPVVSRFQLDPASPPRCDTNARAPARLCAGALALSHAALIERAVHALPERNPVRTPKWNRSSCNKSRHAGACRVLVSGDFGIGHPCPLPGRTSAGRSAELGLSLIGRGQARQWPRAARRHVTPGPLVRPRADAAH